MHSGPELKFDDLYVTFKLSRERPCELDGVTEGFVWVARGQNMVVPTPVSKYKFVNNICHLGTVLSDYPNKNDGIANKILHQLIERHFVSRLTIQDDFFVQTMLAVATNC